jgi:hypothetical protein
LAVQRRRVTVVGRTMIELRRRDGWSIRVIAWELVGYPSRRSVSLQSASRCSGAIGSAPTRIVAVVLLGLLSRVRRQHRWDQISDLSNGGFLAYRNPNESEDEPEILCPTDAGASR